MTTINLPEGLDQNDLFLALIAAANYAEENDLNALAQERRKQAMALQDANDDDDAIDLTEVGAVCHCDQRDADEIAVYFKADELNATLWAIGRITFGDLTDAVNVRHVHGAYVEVEAVALDRLSNF